LRPAGRKSRDTLAGRTSLEAFDRGMWESEEDDDPPPAGAEFPAASGERAPVSRIIVIEDADHLGTRRQPYLRRMMESESATARFMFTARAPSRIIDALRSRTLHIRIPGVEPDRMEATLAGVAARERLEPVAGLVGDMIHVSSGNLRKALFMFELLARTGRLDDRGSVHRLVAASTLQAGRLMVEMALRGRVIEWRWQELRGRKKKVQTGALAELDKMMTEQALDADDIISQLHRVLTSGRLMLAPALQLDMLDSLARCDVRLRRSIHPRIQFERFLHETAAAGIRHGMALT
ncbi:MAG: hypothetical protein CXX72_04520, partial [Methanobacteriota archaeon]